MAAWKRSPSSATRREISEPYGRCRVAARTHCCSDIGFGSIARLANAAHLPTSASHKAAAGMIRPSSSASSCGYHALAHLGFAPGVVAKRLAVPRKAARDEQRAYSPPLPILPRNSRLPPRSKQGCGQDDLHRRLPSQPGRRRHSACGSRRSPGTPTRECRATRSPSGRVQATHDVGSHPLRPRRRRVRRAGRRVILVCTKPGRTMCTETPVPRRASHSPSAKASRPAFAEP